MFCEQCGNQNPDGAKFCTVCGAPMRPVSAQAAQNPAAENTAAGDSSNTWQSAQPSGAASYQSAPAQDTPVYQSAPVPSSNAYEAPKKNDSNATIGLVLGIVGMCCCGVLTIPGLVLSIGSYQKQKSGLALAGIIVNGIGVALWAIGIIVISFNGLLNY